MLARNGFEREARASGRRTIPTWDSKGVRSWIRPLGARVFAFFRSRSDGQALIEMALILPALLILFTGIFTFGIAYMNQLTLTHAVGVGAQQLQLIRSSTTDPCQDTFNAIKAAAPTLQSANINMTITMGSNSPINQTSCSGKQTQLAQGTSNTVQASYPCNLAIYGRVFANSCTLSAQVTEFEY